MVVEWNKLVYFVTFLPILAIHFTYILDDPIRHLEN